MDEKNIAALGFGPEWMLRKLANLRSAKDVAEFRSTYGELEPGLENRGYISTASIFRKAWDAKTAKQKELVTIRLTHLLGNIFDPKRDSAMGGAIQVLRLPGVVADFSSGQIRIQPRNLTDWFVKSLLECRERLAVCEHKGCAGPYFVKTHPRQRFCSAECADTVREAKKKAWWAEHGERFREKWRRERKRRQRGA